MSEEKSGVSSGQSPGRAWPVLLAEVAITGAILAALRFAPALLIPKYDQLVRDVSDIKRGIATIQPFPYEFTRQKGDVVSLAGVGEIDRSRRGVYANISSKLAKAFKEGQIIRVINRESYGSPSVELAIAGTFDPDDPNVVVQVSAEAAKMIGLTLIKGRTCVVVADARKW
jgi:hypothetical protein